MKRKQYTDEQVAFALRKTEAGTAVAEVCRKMVFSEATFFRWKERIAGLGTAEIRRLKRFVANLTPDKTMQDVPRRKW